MGILRRMTSVIFCRHLLLIINAFSVSLWQKKIVQISYEKLFFTIYPMKNQFL